MNFKTMYGAVFLAIASFQVMDAAQAYDQGFAAGFRAAEAMMREVAELKAFLLSLEYRFDAEAEALKMVKMEKLNSLLRELDDMRKQPKRAKLR